MIIVACSAIVFNTFAHIWWLFRSRSCGLADGHPRAPSVERGEAQSKKIPCCWHSQRAFPCAGHPIALCPGSWQAARCARSACVWRGRVCERQGVRITVVRAGRAYCCCCDARDAENVPGRHVYMSFFRQAGQTPEDLAARAGWTKCGDFMVHANDAKCGELRRGARRTLRICRCRCSGGLGAPRGRLRWQHYPQYAAESKNLRWQHA